MKSFYDLATYLHLYEAFMLRNEVVLRFSKPNTFIRSFQVRNEVVLWFSNFITFIQNF